MIGLEGGPVPTVSTGLSKFPNFLLGMARGKTLQEYVTGEDRETRDITP